MAIDDNEVCIDDLDDFDILQNEYEFLFNDFENLGIDVNTTRKSLPLKLLMLRMPSMIMM